MPNRVAINVGYPPGTYPASSFGYPIGAAVLDPPYPYGEYPTPDPAVPCTGPLGYPIPPKISGSATAFGAALGTTPVPVANPAGVAVNDLLIAFVSYDGTTVVAPSTGWSTINAVSGGSQGLYCFARIADGSVNDVLKVTNPTTNDYCAGVLRVVNHSVITMADIKVVSTTFATVADPPNLDAGGSRKWLWLAAAAVDSTAAPDAITAVPATYSNEFTLKSAAATSNSMLAVGSKSTTAQAENPGVFTHTALPGSVMTVAVP